MEPYVSRYELARLMGVSVATVDRMVAEGMPSVTGAAHASFRPSVAIGWAAEGGGRREPLEAALGSLARAGLRPVDSGGT